MGGWAHSKDVLNNIWLLNMSHVYSNHFKYEIVYLDIILRNYADSSYHCEKLPKWFYLLSTTIQNPVLQTITLIAYLFRGIWAIPRERGWYRLVFNFETLHGRQHVISQHFTAYVATLQYKFHSRDACAIVVTSLGQRQVELQWFYSL